MPDPVAFADPRERRLHFRGESKRDPLLWRHQQTFKVNYGLVEPKGCSVPTFRRRQVSLQAELEAFA